MVVSFSVVFAAASRASHILWGTDTPEKEALGEIQASASGVSTAGGGYR